MEDDDGPSRGKIALSFVLTLIAVPVLFVATCVPVGYVSLAVMAWGAHIFKNGERYNPILALAAIIALYVLVFIGLGVRKAVKADNPGIRWGIVLAVAALAVIAAWLAVENWHDLANMG